MGLFSKMKEAGEKQMEEWAKTASEEGFQHYEQQGLDMTRYRAIREAERAKEDEGLQIRYTVDGFDPRTVPNPEDLSRLDPFKPTPRDLNTSFANDVAGKLPMMGKEKYLEKIKNAPLVYGAVVQAHSALWKPDASTGAAGLVIVFALDDAHRYDIAWLKQMALKISQLKHSQSVPQDCVNLITRLRNDQSTFCWKVGASIAGDADAWCGTFEINSSKNLPRFYIPSEGIIPYLLMDEPRENYPLVLNEIPAKYYEI